MLASILRRRRLFSIFKLLLLLATIVIIGCGLYTGLIVMPVPLAFKTINPAIVHSHQLMHDDFIAQAHKTLSVRNCLANCTNYNDVHNHPDTKNSLKSWHDHVSLSSTETEDRTNAKKRSEEYCNVLEHSSYDAGDIPSAYKLSAIAVIIRHGDRTPIYNLPNHKPSKKLSCNLADVTSKDAVRFRSLINSLTRSMQKKLLSNIDWDKSYPKSRTCATGQLTTRGFLQMINLGKHLQKIYFDRKNVFSLNMSSNAYIRVTEYSRTLQSAVGFLFGLLSAENFKQAKIDFDKDVYFCAKSIGNFSCNCPAANQLQKLIKQEYDQLENPDSVTEQLIKEELASVFNTTVGRIPWLGAVLEVLMSHQCHGLDFPCAVNARTKNDCVNWSLLNKMWQFSDRTGWQRFNSTIAEKLGRILSYPLLHEIVTRFLNVTNYRTHETSIRFLLFSGHDKTMSAVLDSLKIHDGHWPPFAANLVFELYSLRKKQYYLRLLYNGKDVTRRVRFCQGIGANTYNLCPFDNFVYFILYDTYQYFRQKNYEEICRES